MSKIVAVNRSSHAMRIEAWRPCGLCFHRVAWVLAERVGIEPTVPLPGQQFSRLPDSATLAPLR